MTYTTGCNTLKITAIHYDKRARAKIARHRLSRYQIDSAIKESTEEAFWGADEQHGVRYIVLARLKNDELLYVSLAPTGNDGEWKLITAFIPSREGYGYD